jgi:DNA-binding NarL/FixJ family response regulator
LVERPSDKKAKQVLKLHADGLSYRLIGRNVGLSKNTVMAHCTEGFVTDPRI